MKKARYSEEQIVRSLREADRDPVAEVAKRQRRAALDGEHAVTH